MTYPLDQPGRHRSSVTLEAARGRLERSGTQPRRKAPLSAEARAEAAQILRAGGGCFLCVPPGAYVGDHTPKPIEDVGVGDGLLMPDGRRGIAVNAATHDYNGVVKTIYARSTLPLQVTDDHLLAVYPALNHRRGLEGWSYRQKVAPEGESPVWRRADEVQPGDFVVCPIPRIEGPEPPERWSSPEACWLLGLLVGDGHTAGRDGKLYYTNLTMGLKKPVAEAVRVLEQMGYRVSVRERQGPVAPLARILVCSRDLAEDVASLIGQHARNKHLPDFAWSSKERLSAALEGVMATDGCRKVHRGSESRDLTTTSLTLAWQIWFAALALGEKPNIIAVRRSSGYPNARPAWRVQWSFGTRKLFTIRLDDTYVLPVRKVETSEYDGPVHDLTADPSPTFVANGMLTHNCGGLHAGSELACPRLATFTLGGDGVPVELRALLPDQSVSSRTVYITEGTFWPNGQWEDPERVILAEDAEESDEPAGDRCRLR